MSRRKYKACPDCYRDGVWLADCETCGGTGRVVRKSWVEPYRRERPGVEYVRSARLHYYLEDGQVWMETKSAWEIWQKDGLPYLIHRIPKRRVYWVVMVDGLGWCPDCQDDVEVEDRLQVDGLVNVCSDCGADIKEGN